MIKSSELRIGNWVLISGDESTIDAYDLYDWSDPIDPIPLTEEWLIKFGFEDLSDGYIFSIDVDQTFKFDWQKRHKLRLSSTSTNFTEWELSGYLGEDKEAKHYAPIATDVKYVHQLQNLYFALTGEELTIIE